MPGLPQVATWRALNTPSPPAFLCYVGRTFPRRMTWAGFPPPWSSCSCSRRQGCRVWAALQTATTTPAELLGVTGRIGQVQPGSRADLVVVDQDPLDDLVALGSVRLVVQDGLVVKTAL